MGKKKLTPFQAIVAFAHAADDKALGAMVDYIAALKAGNGSVGQPSRAPRSDKGRTRHRPDADPLAENGEGDGQ